MAVFASIIKGKALPVGTVRHRKDGDYIKTSDGTWKPYKGAKPKTKRPSKHPAGEPHKFGPDVTFKEGEGPEIAFSRLASVYKVIPGVLTIGVLENSRKVLMVHESTKFSQAFKNVARSWQAYGARVKDAMVLNEWAIGAAMREHPEWKEAYEKRLHESASDYLPSEYQAELVLAGEIAPESADVVHEALRRDRTNDWSTKKPDKYDSGDDWYMKRQIKGVWVVIHAAESAWYDRKSITIEPNRTGGAKDIRAFYDATRTHIEDVSKLTMADINRIAEEVAEKANDLRPGRQKREYAKWVFRENSYDDEPKTGQEAFDAWDKAVEESILGDLESSYQMAVDERKAAKERGWGVEYARPYGQTTHMLTQGVRINYRLDPENYVSGTSKDAHVKRILRRMHRQGLIRKMSAGRGQSSDWEWVPPEEREEKKPKRKAAKVGDKRIWSGNVYVKTKDGWKYQSKAKKGADIYVGGFLGMLFKAGPPPGWEPIPGGQHGGYRRNVGGKYQYWYPSAQHAAQAAQHHAKMEEKFRKKLGRKLRSSGASQKQIDELLEQYSHHAKHAELAAAHHAHVSRVQKQAQAEADAKVAEAQTVSEDDLEGSKKVPEEDQGEKSAPAADTDQSGAETPDAGGGGGTTKQADAERRKTKIKASAEQAATQRRVSKSWLEEYPEGTTHADEEHQKIQKLSEMGQLTPKHLSDLRAAGYGLHDAHHDIADEHDNAEEEPEQKGDEDEPRETGKRASEKVESAPNEAKDDREKRAEKQAKEEKEPEKGEKKVGFKPATGGIFRSMLPFEKARALPVGTVRRRKDGEYIKTSDGKWKPHRGGTKQKREEPQRKHPTTLADVAHKLHNGTGVRVVVGTSKEFSTGRARPTVQQWAAMHPDLDVSEARDFARIVGAPPGTRVSVELNSNANAYIEVSSPTVGATRVIRKDDSGHSYIENIALTIENAPAGTGTRILASQAFHAQRLGFSWMYTEAAGYIDDPDYNGYYTWARLGYLPRLHERDEDQDNYYADEFMYDLRNAIGDTNEPPPNIPRNIDGKHPQELMIALMSTADGRDWWRRHGSDWSGEFNLNPNSHSMRILGAYAGEQSGIKEAWKAHKLSSGRKPAEQLTLTPDEERALDRAWAAVYPPKMQKGRAYPVGTVRDWRGKKMVKTADGWKPVKGGAKPKKRAKAQPKRKPAKKKAAAQPAPDIGHLMGTVTTLDKMPEGAIKSLGLSKYPALGIDPSTVTVDLTGNLDTHAVMKWKDFRGRDQSAYTKPFIEANAAKKWERVKQLAPKVAGAKRKLGNRMNDPKLSVGQRDAAAALLIIANTGLRAGSVANLKANGTQGVTTLDVSSVKIKGNTVSFDFIGKAGKRNTASVNHAALAKYLKTRIGGRKRGRLWTVPPLGETMKAIGLGDHIPKDFRTHLACQVAARELGNMDPPPPLPPTKGGQKRLIASVIKKVSDRVAAQLNNTGTVAKSSYISPAIVQAYLDEVGALKKAMDDLGARGERIWRKALTIRLLGHDAKLVYDGDDWEDPPEELEQAPLPAWLTDGEKEASMGVFGSLLKGRV